MSEPWAYCTTCSRWFYVEAASLPTAPGCPVCATPASHPVDRPAPQRA